MSNRREKPAAGAPGPQGGHPTRGRKRLFLLLLACVLLLVLELPIDKHVETEIEHWFGFHAFFSLLACVVLVLLGKLLRCVIARSENYYDAR